MPPRVMEAILQQRENRFFSMYCSKSPFLAASIAYMMIVSRLVPALTFTSLDNNIAWKKFCIIFIPSTHMNTHNHT